MNIHMSLVSTDQAIQIILILASGVFIGWQIRSAKYTKSSSLVYYDVR